MARNTFVEHVVVVEKLARFFAQQQQLVGCSTAQQERIRTAVEPFVLVEECIARLKVRTDGVGVRF